MAREFISDIIRDSNGKYHIRKDTLNLLVAPCGTGKTTWFFNDVCSQYERRRIVYLVDTVMLEDAMLYEHKDLNIITEYKSDWRKKNLKSIIHEDNRVRVMTYHTFGYLLKLFPEIIDDLDLIFVDEAHNLIKYANYEINNIKDRASDGFSNYDDLLQATQHLQPCNRLAYLLPDLSHKVDIVMATATPNRIYNFKHFEGKFKQIIYDREVEGYYTTHTKTFNNIKNVYGGIVEAGELGNKILIYSKTIKSCEDIAKELEKRGRKPLCLWSTNNKETRMLDYQINAREYLIKNRKLPEPYDVLIITGAYETGWNIDDKSMQICYVNSTEEDVIEQVRGRIRNNILFLGYLEKVQETSMSIKLDEKWINTPLTAKDRELLCEELGRANPFGRSLKWKGIKPILQNCGYIITPTTKRIDGKRTKCEIIS